MLVNHFFLWSFWAFASYYLFLIFYYFILNLVGFFEYLRRGKEHQEENYEVLSFSSFTIPVSIIIPAHNEEIWIADCVQSILNLKYPEYEVIIVDDGSTDKTMSILKELLKLKFVYNSYTDHFSSGRIVGLYRSETYPHVTSISKISGGTKAAAVNAGLNIAKYKFICVLDCDTVLEEDALLKVMAEVHKDPEKVIGIGSYFGLVNGFKIRKGKVVEHSFSKKPIIAHQNLEYIRSFIGNRIGWSKFNAMPNVAGGFGVWRRDILLKLGGYDPQFSSEDIEFTFRAHDYRAKHRKNRYQILMLPHYVGWTEGPSDMVGLINQRDRWQRVTIEAVWRYKYMLFNPKFGMFGLFTFPYFVFYEVFGVFMEVASVIITICGYLMGYLNVDVFLGFVVLMTLSQTLASLMPLFTFNMDQELFKIEEIIYFIFLSLVEFFWYRWLISFGKIIGTFNYIRGVKTFNRIRRAGA